MIGLRSRDLARVCERDTEREDERERGKDDEVEARAGHEHLRLTIKGECGT